MIACWRRFVERILMAKQFSLILKESLWFLKVMDSLKNLAFMQMSNIIKILKCKTDRSGDIELMMALESNIY